MSRYFTLLKDSTKKKDYCSQKFVPQYSYVCILRMYTDTYVCI